MIKRVVENYIADAHKIPDFSGVWDFILIMCTSTHLIIGVTDIITTKWSIKAIVLIMRDKLSHSNYVTYKYHMFNKDLFKSFFFYSRCRKYIYYVMGIHFSSSARIDDLEHRLRVLENNKPIPEVMVDLPQLPTTSRKVPSWHGELMTKITSRRQRISPKEN